MAIVDITSAMRKRLPNELGGIGVPQSNLVLYSNIYKHNGRLNDEDFVARVRGYTALKKLQEQLGTNYDHLLTSAQKEELVNGPPKCPYDEDLSFGYVRENGKLKWVHRCEMHECPRYPKCSDYPNFRPIYRDAPRFPSQSAIHERPRIIDWTYLEPLGSESSTSFQIELHGHSESVADLGVIDERNTVDDGAEVAAVQEVLEEPLTLEASQKLGQNYAFMYSQISDPTPLITCPSSNRVLVNAGPGTGKTYTVIQRLAYLVQNDMVNPQNVLVLCFSRDAVSVIRERLEAEIRSGTLPWRTRELFHGIRTLDSYATWMIRDVCESLDSMYYDDRIEEFITQLEGEPDALENLEYLIVDEIQDLVGVRARMIQSILKHIHCGFMLLGDKCQSIFDYQVAENQNELTSKAFYAWLETSFESMDGYELTNNHRQTPALAMISNDLRTAILSSSFPTAKQTVSEYMELIEEMDISLLEEKLEEQPDQKWAILCRNNARVAALSNELYCRDIEHSVALGSQHAVLVPWIAQVLSRFTDRHISFKDFHLKALELGLSEVEAKWKVLKELEGEDVEEVLEIARLRDTLLWRRNIPKELDLALQTSNVVVSTIHRAKGKEYDNVLWVIEGDEAKEPNVVYVAVSRPKTGLYISEVKKPLYVKSLPSSRLIESRWSRRRSAKNPHCSAIVLGLEGDVDPFSVLSKERAAAIERQEYIEKYVQPGDSVEIGLLDGRYRVFHGGREIAWLSERVVNDLWNGMQVTNRSRNYPKELRGCYIRAVTTLVNRGFNESVPEPFALSCFWLGIEVGGLAKTSWY